MWRRLATGAVSEDDDSPDYSAALHDPTKAVGGRMRQRREMRQHYAAQLPHPNLARVPASLKSAESSGMRLPLSREGGRRAHVLRGLGRVVLGGLGGGRVCLEDNVQVVVAAHDHVFPLGEGGQTDVCDGGLEGDFVGVLLPLLRQIEILLVNVHAAGAPRDGLPRNAHEGQVGIWRMAGQTEWQEAHSGGGYSRLSSSAQRAPSVVDSRPVAPERYL